MKPVLLSIAALVIAAALLAPLSRAPSTIAPGDPARPVSPPGDASGAPAGTHQRELFPPENLVLLEVSDRAVWQEPEVVMDELLIAEASEVADIGAGSGWFTMRLAQRVGPNGTVYAQDVQQEMVTAITRRIEREKLTNVRVVRGDDTSPNLPHGALDAVLVVDVYPEIRGSRVGFLQTLAAALRPKGRIGIVNYKPGVEGGPGPEPESRVSREVVEDEAREAGLRVISTLDLRYQYLVVLGR